MKYQATVLSSLWMHVFGVFTICQNDNRIIFTFLFVILLFTLIWIWIYFLFVPLLWEMKGWGCWAREAFSISWLACGLPALLFAWGDSQCGRTALGSCSLVSENEAFFRMTFTLCPRPQPGAHGLCCLWTSGLPGLLGPAPPGRLPFGPSVFLLYSLWTSLSACPSGWTAQLEHLHVLLRLWGSSATAVFEACLLASCACQPRASEPGALPVVL